MEPLTHFLTGACMGRAGFNRKTALATLTMTLAAEAPDLDIATIVKGRVFYFAHHRGFTHSFLGLLLVSAAVVALVYGYWKTLGGKLTDESPPRWGLLFLFAYIAGLGHILLDFTNSYGVRPFWPFSERWYSWDIEFIVEPVLLILLIGGLVLPKLSSLINDEIGARRKKLPGRLAASVALIAVILFWGLRDYEHRRAVNALDARTYEGMDAIRTSAYPDWLNPFRWVGVIETDNLFATMEVNSLIPEVDPQEQMSIHYKSPETPVTIAAKKAISDACIWIGPSIPSPKQKRCNRLPDTSSASKICVMTIRQCALAALFPLRSNSTATCALSRRVRDLRPQCLLENHNRTLKYGINAARP